MAITYPISLPSDSIAQPVKTTFRIRRIIGQTQSPFSGKTQTFKHTGEWWEAEISLPPMKQAVAKKWVASLYKWKWSNYIEYRACIKNKSC